MAPWRLASSLGYDPPVASPKDLNMPRAASPTSISSMQVDVTTRMGALTPAISTGLHTLDGMLIGGLRAGVLMVVGGAPGVGRTAFALLLAYMAARARAAAIFASASLDETEVIARLAARALHREYPDATTSYGAIWSGQAWQDDVTRRAVTQSVDTVVKKVGGSFYVHRTRPFASTAELGKGVAQLWGRYDKVLLVVDDMETYAASVDEQPEQAAMVNQSYESRIAQVGFELAQLAEQGCAVVATVLARHLDLASPSATLAAELRPSSAAPENASERL
ncbi:MAG TPA: DnaB-like helicase C-terminal domain-containing protein, partial [Polyangiaceae bacterium]